MSSQALGHHVLQGQGQTCALTARQQRAYPPKEYFTGRLHLSTTAHPPPEPPNHTGEFLGREGSIIQRLEGPMVGAAFSSDEQYNYALDFYLGAFA